MAGLAKKLLLVDDDPAFVETLTEQLRQSEGFAVAAAATGKEALDKIRAEYFDVIILDVGLPDMDGRETCRVLRQAGIRTPIIMLTGADTDIDAIKGLESGASDYVTKPFRIGVLLARIRAHIRQHELSDDAVFTVGPYVFQPSARMLVHKDNKKKVRLTDKEAAILKYLYRAGDRAIPREALLGEVWGYNAGVTTHTLETHVYRLRQKIEREPGRAEILITEPGGYRLVP
jgi:DNA-binding response OmpR family regulator